MPIWLILIFRCVYKVVPSRVLARVFSSLPHWPRSSFYTTKGYHNGQLEYAFLPNTEHVPEEQNDGWTPNGHRPLLSERYAVLLPPFWLGSSTDSLSPSWGSILSGLAGILYPSWWCFIHEPGACGYRDKYPCGRDSTRDSISAYFTDDASLPSIQLPWMFLPQRLEGAPGRMRARFPGLGYPSSPEPNTSDHTHNFVIIWIKPSRHHTPIISWTYTYLKGEV
jgi:hypothetical protein